MSNELSYEDRAMLHAATIEHRRRAGLEDPCESWKSISGDSAEKYGRYLTSREWSEKKQEVLKRADGICERCHLHSASQIHHLTYARKYDEPLEDLLAVCEACHRFVHGFEKVDPRECPPFDEAFQVRFLTTLEHSEKFRNAVMRLTRR